MSSSLDSVFLLRGYELIDFYISHPLKFNKMINRVSMSIFIGRKEELARLNRLNKQKKSKLVVLKGRRRIGKSTLVKECAKSSKFISLSGIPPSKNLTDQKQRDEFANQLCTQLNLPRVTFLTWTDAFNFLSTCLIKDEQTVILFDEISWMAELDPSFLGSLKTFWDQNISQKENVMLILCGSISTWIEKNILESTGFVGRISLVIHLKPLTLPESVLFLRKKGFKGSIYEIFKILSVTGGIPWYIDLIDPNETADKNIYELCFEPTCQLINEFKIIFHDLFRKKGFQYRKILNILIDGMKTQDEIRKKLLLKKGGTISKYLKNLITAGFITKHYQWSFKNLKLGRQKLYRLSDCYIRFYLKYVEPFKDIIEQGLYKKAAKGKLPGWDTIMGFQFESLLLSNREFLFQLLNIDTDVVERDNPYIQYPSKERDGCQVDYLIQTKLNSLICCEFKFRKNELNTSIIKEMTKKISSLDVPKGFGIAPALFHFGGVSPKVEESGFFYKIIDLRDSFEDLQEKYFNNK
jgi:uncharacterized protein